MIKYLKNQWMWFKIDNAPILGDDKGNAFFIERIQKANPEWSTVKINNLIEEYKQFMYLAGTSDEDCTPSQDVDKVWHEHILFTRDYYDYCNRIIGKIIHHKPERGGDPKKYDEAFKNTNAKKKAVFKPTPSPKPSVISHPSVQPVDTSLTDMLLLHTILNVSHEPCHEPSPSHASCSSHSESSHSSCSSSNSSSSCSSSSCGGGGGD